MYDETKKAIKKAFKIGKLIFGIGPEKYNILFEATNNVKCPSHKELKHYIDEGLCFEDALVMELKKRYIEAARQAGFNKKYGLAMLEYAAMMEEVK